MLLGTVPRPRTSRRPHWQLHQARHSWWVGQHHSFAQTTKHSAPHSLALKMIGGERILKMEPTLDNLAYRLAYPCGLMRGLWLLKCSVQGDVEVNHLQAKSLFCSS